MTEAEVSREPAELDRESKEALNRYELNDSKTWLLREGPLQLVAAYLSPIACVVLVRIASGQDKTRLAIVMRTLKVCLQEHNIECPMVAVVFPSNADVHEDLAAWGADQEWHRGEFVLFAADQEEEAARKAFDLLVSEPPKAQVPYAPQELKAIVSQWAHGTGVLHELHDIWTRRETMTAEMLGKEAPEEAARFAADLVEEALRLTKGAERD